MSKQEEKKAEEPKKEEEKPWTLTITDKDRQAVLLLRSAVWQQIQALRPGDPIRAALLEAMFNFQVSAHPELRP